jgi:hypothetical protein
MVKVVSEHDRSYNVKHTGERVRYVAPVDM